MSRNLTITCDKCGKERLVSLFPKVRQGHPFHLQNPIHICLTCLDSIIGDSTEQMDKFCQYMDYPFLADKWTPNPVFSHYYRSIMLNGKSLLSPECEYDGGVDWQSVNEEWKKLQTDSSLAIRLYPELNAHEITKLRMFWETDGQEKYTVEQLQYLDKLYKDTERTQNIATGAQIDQAKKLARLSLDMDIAQRDGDLSLFTSLMRAYVELIKIAEFTPKSATSNASFETVGELITFLERTGFLNTFYDGEERDIVDKTIKNQQMFLQRIVAGEGTLSERIAQRLDRMNALDRLEDGISPEDVWSYDTESDEDWVVDGENAANDDTDIEQEELNV